MMHGGYREDAGRKLGSLNKRTLEVETKIRETFSILSR